jgi:hypothetical protein
VSLKNGVVEVSEIARALCLPLWPNCRSRWRNAFGLGPVSALVRMATALPAPDDAVVPTERQLQVEDPSIAVRNVLIHRYAENSDSWAPLAEELMKDHTVVVPDLRGIGKSSKPEGGYDKKTQAKDMPAVVTALMVRSMNFDIKVDPQALLFSQLPDQIELKSQSVGRELYRRRTAEVQANRNCRAGFACDTL